MKDKKVNLIVLIVLVAILSILGVSYAALSYRKTGADQNLIVGDIYMHYNEHNQIYIQDGMPTNIDKYKGYQVNPIMQEQDVDGTNELSRCIELYEDWGYSFEPDAESFCRGYGTSSNVTIQEDLDNWYTSSEYFLDDGGQELLDAGIITPKIIGPQKTKSYRVNENMSSDELNSCVDIYTNLGYEFDMDAESFCNGEGTAYGLTIQEDLNDWYYNNEYFLEDGGQELLDLGVIIEEMSDAKIYVVNKEMTEEEINTCVTILRDEWQWEKQDGESWEDYCAGTGTIYDQTFQEALDEVGYLYYSQFKQLEENNIIELIPLADLPYFEFTIDGKNTNTRKDIKYEILLNYGDSNDTRTTRIRDELLRFALVEIKDGQERTVAFDEKYDNIVGSKIWENTILNSTTEEIEITYKLYMWIDKTTIIGNKNQDYTMEEWQDVFASIKVDVNGELKNSTSNGNGTNNN